VFLLCFTTCVYATCSLFAIIYKLFVFACCPVQALNRLVRSYLPREFDYIFEGIQDVAVPSRWLLLSGVIAGAHAAGRLRMRSSDGTWLRNPLDVIKEHAARNSFQHGRPSGLLQCCHFNTAEQAKMGGVYNTPGNPLLFAA